MAQLHEFLVGKAMKCESTDSCFPSAANEQPIHHIKQYYLCVHSQKVVEMLEKLS